MRENFRFNEIKFRFKKHSIFSKENKNKLNEFAGSG